MRYRATPPRGPPPCAARRAAGAWRRARTAEGRRRASKISRRRCLPATIPTRRTTCVRRPTAAAVLSDGADGVARDARARRRRGGEPTKGVADGARADLATRRSSAPKPAEEAKGTRGRATWYRRFGRRGSRGTRRWGRGRRGVSRRGETERRSREDAEDAGRRDARGRRRTRTSATMSMMTRLIPIVPVPAVFVPPTYSSRRASRRRDARRSIEDTRRARRAGTRGHVGRRHASTSSRDGDGGDGARVGDPRVRVRLGRGGASFVRRAPSGGRRRRERVDVFVRGAQRAPPVDRDDRLGTARVGVPASRQGRVSRGVRRLARLRVRRRPHPRRARVRAEVPRRLGPGGPRRTRRPGRRSRRTPSLSSAASFARTPTLSSAVAPRPSRPARAS